MNLLGNRVILGFGAMLLVASFVVPAAMADDMGGMDGMSGMGDSPSSGSGTVGHGKGVVKAVDRKEGTVTIQHGPIEEFGWSGMTMTFALEHRSSVNSLKKGEHVRFDVVKEGNGSYVITEIMGNDR